MAENTNEQEAFALQAMFGRAIPPVSDQGFSNSVVKRVQQENRKRRLVLLPAVAIGIAMALPAISQFLLMLSNELLGLVARAEQSETIGQFQVLLSILPFRETAQAVSDEITQVGAEIGKVSWYQQNFVLILAGLAALVSLLATRMIER